MPLHLRGSAPSHSLLPRGLLTRYSPVRNCGSEFSCLTRGHLQPTELFRSVGPPVKTQFLDVRLERLGPQIKNRRIGPLGPRMTDSWPDASI